MFFYPDPDLFVADEKRLTPRCKRGGGEYIICFLMVDWNSHEKIFVSVGDIPIMAISLF